MTPEDVARIRHNCVEPDRYLGERYALALCDALEQAWEQRDEWKASHIHWRTEFKAMRERAERAEALHAEFFTLADKQAAALARVRNLCDDTELDVWYEPASLSPAEIRAAIEDA